MPVGIWALLILAKPEVKSFFETGPGSSHIPPPQGS
jgi:hypothetical protein